MLTNYILSESTLTGDPVFALLESIPEEAFLIDKEGIILSANTRFAKRFSLSLEECIGAVFYDLIANLLHLPEVAAYRKARCEEVFRSGRRAVFEDESALRRVTINPVLSEEGDVSRLFITTLDISAHKEIEAKLQAEKPRFSQALQAARAGVWEWNLVTDELLWSSEIWPLYGLEEESEQPTFRLWSTTIHPEDRQMAIETVVAAAANEGELHVEYRVCYPDGSLHWLMSRGKPLRDESGRATHYIGTSIDITDRKLLENELMESKIRFSYALEASRSGIWEWDVETDELSWSRQLWQLYGLEVGSVLLNHQLCVDTIHPDDRAMASRIIRAAVGKEVAASVEYRVVHPDGSIHWLTSRGMPLFEGDGRLSRYIGTVIDITERKQIELELLESERRLGQALEAARAGVWEWDLITNDNIWSSEIWRLYGLEPRSANPSFQLWQSSIHPDDRQTAVSAVTGAAESGSELNAEYRVKHPDGSVHWMMSRGKPLCDESGRVVRYIGTIIDITERKQVELTLEESKLRFSQALDATNAGVWEWDIHTDKVLWSDQIWALYGLEPYCMPPSHKLCATAVHPDDREMTFDTIMAAANSESEVNIEYRVCHSDGSIHWLKCRGMPIYDADGRVACYIGTVMGITKRKTTELLMQESELKFRNIFAFSPVAIGIGEIQDGHLFEVNAAWLHLFGYTREEFTEQNLSEPGCCAGLGDREKIISGLREHGSIINSPVTLLKKNGDPVKVLYSAELIMLEEREYLLVMMSDITVQELQQESINQLELAVMERTEQLRLEVERLQRFLSMISHEYRTPLAIIRGNLNLIELKHKNGDYGCKVELLKINRAIDRLVEVMEVSIQESRLAESHAASTMMPLRIAPVIASQVDSFCAMWQELSVLYREELDGCAVFCEPAQLKLAIFNLLDNARKYAVPDSLIELHCCREADAVVIKIRNQGELFPEDEAEALFEKFRRGANSTNTAGAGLGLWLVRNIINQHHGRVTLAALGSSVEATVRLPLVPQEEG